MPHARIQVEHAGDFLGVFDLKIDHVVEPILAAAVPVLHRDGHRIPSTTEETIQLELNFDVVAGLEISESALLQPSIRAEHVHADSIANQDADYGVGDMLFKFPSILERE